MILTNQQKKKDITIINQCRARSCKFIICKLFVNFWLIFKNIGIRNFLSNHVLNDDIDFQVIKKLAKINILHEFLVNRKTMFGNP